VAAVWGGVVSCVTDVIVICACGEKSALQSINAWMIEHSETTCQFAKIDGYAGGNKYMQVDVFAIAINNFSHKTPYLSEYVLVDMKWNYPESVILITQEENDETPMVRKKT
jgi:hypothetical protein